MRIDTGSDVLGSLLTRLQPTRSEVGKEAVIGLELKYGTVRLTLDEMPGRLELWSSGSEQTIHIGWFDNDE